VRALRATDATAAPESGAMTSPFVARGSRGDAHRLARPGAVRCGLADDRVHAIQHYLLFGAAVVLVGNRGRIGHSAHRNLVGRDAVSSDPATSHSAGERLRADHHGEALPHCLAYPLHPHRAMKKDMIDVLELLTSQHAEVDQLMEQLESGKGDRMALFTTLADKLAAHATVEEKIFYPAAMTTQTSELLHESVEEHLAIKRVLADMLQLDPNEDEEDFDAKLSVLKEGVSHHAHEEEEAKLFPMLRRTMSEDDRAALGNEVLAMFEVLLQRAPREQVPNETEEPASLPPV
jgi:hypothetical protein